MTEVVGDHSERGVAHPPLPVGNPSTSVREEWCHPTGGEGVNDQGRTTGYGTGGTTVKPFL